MRARLLTCSAAPILLALSAGAQSLVRSVNGPAAGAQFGKACIAIADQNGDGFEDLLVGAPAFNQQKGALYCYSGAYLATGTGTQTLWSITGGIPGNRFGAAVADVGDIDGDGHGDFLVGMPGDDSGASDAGAVCLVDGSSHSIVSTLNSTAVAAGLGSAIL